MAAGPLNSQRQQQLLDDAQEFMTEFSKEFLKMYGLAMFERIKDEMDGSDDDKKLKYRDWKSIERPDVFTGECFMRTGEGPGAFGGWKKVFLVERKDYNIAVYPDEKTYIAGKKPKTVIRTAGYSMESETSYHYSRSMRSIGAGIGFSDESTRALTTFSPYSWALAHPWRPNYMFQLHKGKSPACGCFGGSAVEPEDAGQEFASQRGTYVTAFERCTSFGNPRNLDSVTGKAFDLTVSKLKSKFSTLDGFNDEGFEAEILVDMLLQHCLTPMRDDMLHDLMGPESMKLVLWYKTQGMVQKLLQGVANPVWGTTQKAAQALGEKIEPQIKKGIQPILQVKENVKQKIREKIVDKMGAFLQKHVTPYIDPILKAFDKPMTKGFEYAKQVFQNNVDMNNLPADPRQRNFYLDNLPRTNSLTCKMSEAADELVQPLSDIKRINEETFADLDPVELKNMAEMSLLTTLDAAVYTLECHLDEKGSSPSLKEDILHDFDHDVMVSRSDFTKEVVRSLLIMGFRRAIGPVVDPLIGGLDDMIPEDVRDFISVAAVFEEIVDLLVGEPIEKMVEGAYPKPKK